jgi:hypothetical protein
MKYFILTLLSIVFLCQLGSEINTATATVVDLASPSGTAVTGTVHKNLLLCFADGRGAHVFFYNCA